MTRLIKKMYPPVGRVFTINFVMQCNIANGDQIGIYVKSLPKLIFILIYFFITQIIYNGFTTLKNVFTVFQVPATFLIKIQILLLLIPGIQSNLVTMSPRYYITFDRPQQNSIEKNLLRHPLISLLCHVHFVSQCCKVLNFVSNFSYNVNKKATLR